MDEDILLDTLELPKNIQQRLIAISETASAQSDRVIEAFKKAQLRKEKADKQDTEIKEKVKIELTEAAKDKREKKRLIRMGLPLPKPEKKNKVIEPVLDEKGIPIVSKNERKVAMLAYDKEKHEERKQRVIQKKKQRAEKALADKLITKAKQEAILLRFKNAEIKRNTKKANSKFYKAKEVKIVRLEPETPEWIANLKTNEHNIPYAA